MIVVENPDFNGIFLNRMCDKNLDKWDNNN